MSQETTLREICELFKNYRLGSKDPEIQKWYYRLKAKDEQTIVNLQEYLNKKIFNPNRSRDISKMVKPSPETEHKKLVERPTSERN